MITQKIDSKTGLPEIPEGYFWRVRYSLMDRHYWYVELRQLSWYGSKIIKRHTCAGRMNEYKIREHADTILWVLGGKGAVAQGRKRTDLTGDYPPKKLGEAK